MELQQMKQNNPFGNMQKAKAQETSLVEVESQRAIQEVQAAMVIAKKFPRNSLQAMDSILQACTRPTLAQGALYSYPRGGQDVTGPSIRLAEAIAQTWGNIQFGIRELSQSNGESTVEAFAWDLETNTRQVKVFQVPHGRYTRSGGLKMLDDPRDIYEVVANQGARRLRACILGVIPGDVIESAVNQCDITLSEHADSSPEAIKKMIVAFSEYRVNEDMIKKRIGRRLESINSPQMVQLKKIYASLRDGMSNVSDWFETTNKTDIDSMKGSDSKDKKASDPEDASVRPKEQEATTKTEVPEQRAEEKQKPKPQSHARKSRSLE